MGDYPEHSKVNVTMSRKISTKQYESADLSISITRLLDPIVPANVLQDTIKEVEGVVMDELSHWEEQAREGRLYSSDVDSVSRGGGNGPGPSPGPHSSTTSYETPLGGATAPPNREELLTTKQCNALYAMKNKNQTKRTMIQGFLDKYNYKHIDDLPKREASRLIGDLIALNEG